jgi:UDP-N-acetyl-D-glucosamine dehydrogenase
MKDNILKKLDNKLSVIGIIGLGYVGIPLLLRFASEGFKVIGFDNDLSKIDSMNDGKSTIKHIESSEIEDAIENGFKATADYSEISQVDVVIICLPTPLNQDKTPDLSYVINSVEKFKTFLRPGQIISLESTTYPGTTEEELLPRIESQGLIVGSNIFLLYSPEREDPGNPDFNPKNIPKIVSGHTSECLEIGIKLYGSVVDRVVPLSDLKTAEMTKLLENIYRAVNIGLINEMKIVADAMDIDIYEVIAGASSKPFGFTPFYPGPGLGGHCIPIDPFYLTWKAKEYGVKTRFIELAGEVNTNMPSWIIGKIEDTLYSVNKKIEESNILILGLAYKKNIDDVRESPSVELFSLLTKKGANVNYSDPFISNFPKMRKYDFCSSSIEITPENIASYDLVLLATDHDNFDYELIHKYSKIIVDTRGVFLKPSAKIIRA